MRLSYREAMAQYAHSVLVDAIVEAGGKGRAAKLLGLNRTHFYALCRRYQVPSSTCTQSSLSNQRTAMLPRNHVE